MNDFDKYPARCRKNIRRLMQFLSADAGTVYDMMRMTATLMDLRPEDDDVARMILQDCCVECEV